MVLKKQIDVAKGRGNVYKKKVCIKILTRIGLMKKRR